MTKNHLKRINAPKTWPIARKETVFIVRPQPSGHSMAASLPISLLLKEVLGIANTTRAVRFILNTQEVLVNGRRVRRPEASAGLMDVVSFPAAKTSFRILINDRNKLFALPIAGDEAKFVPSRVTSKRLQKGKKLQVGCHNGSAVLYDKACKVGDTLLLTFESKVHAHYALAQGAFVLVTSGKHVGKAGTVERIADGTVAIKAPEGTVETLAKHAFVLGSGASTIKLKSN